MTRNTYFMRGFVLFLVALVCGCASTSNKGVPSGSKAQDMTSAVNAVAESLKGNKVSAKYCPLCGKHFSRRVMKCPDDQTLLEEIKE